MGGIQGRKSPAPSPSHCFPDQEPRQLLPLPQEVLGMCRNSLSSPGKQSWKLILLPMEVALPRENSGRNPDFQSQQHLEHPTDSPRPQFHVEKTLACGKIFGKVESPLKFCLNSSQARNFLPQLPKIHRIRSHPWDTPGATPPLPSFPYSASFLDSRTKEFLPARIPPVSSCCFSRDTG